jgi:formyltetrahydrofolate deformylase
MDKMTAQDPPPPQATYILRVTCLDAIGIVADVAGFLAARRLKIVESADFGDPATGLFFMRTVFTPESADFQSDAFATGFQVIADRWRMEWQIRDAHARPNVLLLVSTADHCLNDLLYRHRTGALEMNVPAIVSNHTGCQWLAERHGVSFHHVPVSPDTRGAAERRMLDLIDDLRIDLVVLARYMQVLSNETCAALAGRCINIHHSFLPSFKGAAPYRQAWERGVKLIGATAHYVTPDLDEGPIIAQSVEPATHAATPSSLAAIGRDTEARVLAKAVRLHIQGRIFLNGAKTVVFE